MRGEDYHDHQLSGELQVHYEKRRADGNSWDVIDINCPVTVNLSEGKAEKASNIPRYCSLYFIMKIV